MKVAREVGGREVGGREVGGGEVGGGEVGGGEVGDREVEDGEVRGGEVGDREVGDGEVGGGEVGGREVGGGEQTLPLTVLTHPCIFKALLTTDMYDACVEQGFRRVGSGLYRTELSGRRVWFEACIIVSKKSDQRLHYLPRHVRRKPACC